MLKTLLVQSLCVFLPSCSEAQHTVSEKQVVSFMESNDCRTTRGELTRAFAPSDLDDAEEEVSILLAFQLVNAGSAKLADHGETIVLQIGDLCSNVVVAPVEIPAPVEAAVLTVFRKNECWLGFNGPQLQTLLESFSADQVLDVFQNWINARQMLILVTKDGRFANAPDAGVRLVDTALCS